MPMNEARSYNTRELLPSNKYRVEAHAAILGLEPRGNMEKVYQPSTQALTPDEAARLRELLLQHDVQHASEDKEFDLNNPPKKQYIHQPWPLTLHYHGGTPGKHKIVKNEKELAIALKQGYKKEPPPLPVEDVDVEVFDDAPAGETK